MTQVKLVMSRNARLYRAMSMADKPRAGRRDLTSEEKRIARHMAHDGATVKEIGAKINWTLSEFSLSIKLKAINIKTKRSLSNYYHRD